MVTLARRAARIPFAPVVATLFGVVAAILVAAVPQWLFARGVIASGLPLVLAAAAPPLGLVARLLAVTLAFVITAGILMIVLVPLARRLDGQAGAQTPWRDGGYDAPEVAAWDGLAPRRPIFAPDELGAPLMSDAAIASVPLAAAEDELSKLAAPLAIGEFDDKVSIAALIRRLEEGLARRGTNDPDPDTPASGPQTMPNTWILPEPDQRASAAPTNDDDEAVRQALGTLRKLARG